jgi:hypothetical protein
MVRGQDAFPEMLAILLQLTVKSPMTFLEREGLGSIVPETWLESDQHVSTSQLFNPSQGKGDQCGESRLGQSEQPG